MNSLRKDKLISCGLTSSKNTSYLDQKKKEFSSSCGKLRDEELFDRWIKLKKTRISCS